MKSTGTIFIALLTMLTVNGVLAQQPAEAFDVGKEMMGRG